MNKLFSQYLQQNPIIAILRGIQPQNCLAISQILYDLGIRIIEVPLNSPNPFISIQRLADTFQHKAIIGAGTVLTDQQVEQVYQAGGKIIIAPNLDLQVGIAAKQRQMLWLPGVFTPSEAFLALNHGADALKIFPAEAISPQTIKAWRTVLPVTSKLIAVGGINHHNIHLYLTYCDGIGIGNGLFNVGDDTATVLNKTKSILQTIN
ncbi:2-dehydro-3-deoxy-6-phosphogalactonate aldolase [Volucribacter amazonae]|uniref:2-dehydro-3-deoxy-6-phosphogalactonate aldolase n=1 Tax=Volucribacter amazonae TaxID=256731 RepID=A0A9X4PD42_9PAST|nr:2-dehydro-3-deoxy-6-phosphogalactonate aldolase [Volucribacter amazonae]MDG6896092.1 hypothetical protein [Volucribacter amazonae]